MKVVIITIIILALFFGSSIWLNGYIAETTKNLVERIENLDQAIDEENWEKAEESLKAFNDEWGRTKKRWQTFLEHYEIDSIDMTLAKVQRYVAVEERVLALGELARLKMLVQHVEDKNNLELTNIL